jgi:hypothetical protein
MRRVRARVATTHPIPADGGIRLHEEAIRQIAEAMAAASTSTWPGIFANFPENTPVEFAAVKRLSMIPTASAPWA